MGNVELLKNNGVKVLESLEFWGDLESYDDALMDFKDSLKDKINNLKEFKNNKDYENYGIIAHSTKSEAKYLGFVNEAEIFLQHELAGKNDDDAFINSHFAELENTINKIDKLLDNYSKKEEKKKILVADDSDIMLKYIEKTIGDEYEIIKCGDGSDAIEKIQNFNIYAILLDLNMPKTNGFGVLEYLKENVLIEQIPVIVVTGDDTKDTIKRAFSYPILDVLNKPFKEDNIRRVLVSIKSFYEKN